MGVWWEIKFHQRHRITRWGEMIRIEIHSVPSQSALRTAKSVPIANRSIGPRKKTCLAHA